MGKNAPTLDSLPSPLLLDLCSHLDLISLLALSEVNQCFRRLAQTWRAYWLPAILQATLVLPIPSHVPLISLEASELSLLVRRAVFKEKNLSSQDSRLLSHSVIQWPWVPGRMIVNSQGSRYAETPNDAVYRLLSHPNGEWLFLVSKDAAVRLLHLRTGTLAWDKQFCPLMVPNDGVTQPVCFAVDFLGDLEALMVIATDERWRILGEGEEPPSENEKPKPVSLRIYRISFDPLAGRAAFEEISVHWVESMPLTIDLAYDYVIWRSLGPLGGPEVRLLDWKQGEEKQLPLLLPPVHVVIYRGYFFSVGMLSPSAGGLQVVSLPKPKDPTRTSNDEEEEYFQLVATLPFPTADKILFDWDTADMSHVYFGECINVINVWIRAGNRGSNCIFTFYADFSKPPSRWFEWYDPPLFKALLGDKGQGGKEETWVEYRHVWDYDPSSMLDGPTPAAPGRRFIWAQLGGASIQENEIVPDDGWESQSTWPRYIELASSVIEDLKPTRVLDLFTEDQEAVTMNSSRYDVQKWSSLKSPKELVINEGEVIWGMHLEERSGTIILLLSNGSIWTLRYGAP